MSHDAHVQALADKHANLERIIGQEISRPSPNSLTIAELKRRKLQIKEKLRVLSH